jgi:HAMP domain-containing protein
MGLRAKFNISILAAFLIGLGLVAAFSWKVIRDNARTEVIHEARLIAAEAAAIRRYTVVEVRPLLANQSRTRFLPHTVPAFAAATTQRDFTAAFPDYTYKEAALNPTNPANRATAVEKAIIEDFRREGAPDTVITTRDSAAGPILSISRPLRIESKDCLTCHSTPAAAPAAMVDVYGPDNGFGWNLNEVIGAQIVSVPMQVSLNRANDTFFQFIGGASLIFAGVLALLNLLLHFVVIRPIRAMSDLASAISTGDLSGEEFAAKGKDEIASLAQSFNRMRRSLVSAMKLLDS